jgi:hypothetical protein
MPEQKNFTAHVAPRRPKRPILGPDNPETVAIEAIKRVEKAINEKFGIELQAGIELEYGVFIPPGAKSYPTALRRKPKILREDYTPSGHRRSRRDPFFPNSPSVAYSYPENTVNRSNGDEAELVHEHETVLSHHGLHRGLRTPDGQVPYRTIPMGEGRLVQLARETEALRRTIAYPQTTLHPDATRSKAGSHRLEQFNRDFPYRVTDAYAANILGMHVNISMWDAKQKSRKNITSLLQKVTSSGPKHEENLNVLSAIQMRIWQAAEHILLSTEASKQRKNIYGSHDALWFFEGNNHNTTHIEYQLPPASANPYYAALISLVATYELLEAVDYKSGRPINTRALDALAQSKTIAWNEREASLTEVQRVFFAPNNRFREVLNTIQPQLGDRLVEAIKRYPPGQEKTREEAGIISLSECFEAVDRDEQARDERTR